ncbi:MAG: methyltransferase domain-containing protein [Pyrinomonadaceae bacterium]|nr:methyltransferase domain-containing protein [Pyrinomonadaceae bacterium]
MSAAEQQSERENLWGYAKRLRFARRAMAQAFPSKHPSLLRVLDAGCGNGSQLALPLVKAGFQVWGVDTDERSIEHARRLTANSPNARFFCGRVEELPESELFDIVILSEVLEHLTEPQELLKASTQRVRAGGILIVTVPNGYGEFEMDSWLFRNLRLQYVVDALTRGAQGAVVGSTDNHESGHVQFFTRGRLRKLFDECDLKIFLEGASSLLSGPIIGHTLARSQSFIEWNARAADKLPPVFASGWYFALRPRERKT